MEAHVLWGVSGSVIRPVLFNIFLIDVFLLWMILTLLYLYRWQYPLYSMWQRWCCSKLLKWFKRNQMKDNAYKCLLIVLILRARDSIQIQIENSFIKSYLSEKLLGVKFDHQLSFDRQVKSLCKKRKCKIKSVHQGRWYMGWAQKEINNEFLFCCTIQLWPANMDDS